MNKTLTKKGLNSVLAAVCIAGTMCFSNVNAAENVPVLSGLQINPTENGSYQIILKADKDIPVKKYVTADNTVVLDIKGVKASDSINTVYNNASDVDHVVFQPVKDNHIKVFVQGKNISDSNIKVESPVLPSDLQKDSIKNSQETLVLNAPVDSYRPVVNLEEESAIEEKQVSQSYLASLFDKSNTGWLISFLMFVAFAIVGLKALFPENKKINIKISDDLNTREKDLYKNLNRHQGLIGKSLGAPSTIKNLNQKPTISSVNYGLREYQNSQINPNYRSMTSARMPVAQKIKPDSSKITLKTSQAKTLKTKTAVSSSKISANDINDAKINIDSMRFLESMAKIYEKSGRVDLAHGLQNNIMKAKISKFGI